MTKSNRLTDWHESMASASRATASDSGALHDEMARLRPGIKGALTLNSSRPRPSRTGVARGSAASSPHKATSIPAPRPASVLEVFCFVKEIFYFSLAKDYRKFL